MRNRPSKSRTPARSVIMAVTRTAAIPGAQPVAKPRIIGGLVTRPCEPSASRIRKGQAKMNIRPYMESSGLRFTRALKPFLVVGVTEEIVDIFHLLYIGTSVEDDHRLRLSLPSDKRAGSRSSRKFF